MIHGSTRSVVDFCNLNQRKKPKKYRKTPQKLTSFQLRARNKIILIFFFGTINRLTSLCHICSKLFFFVFCCRCSKIWSCANEPQVCVDDHTFEICFSSTHRLVDEEPCLTHRQCIGTVPKFPAACGQWIECMHPDRMDEVRCLPVWDCFYSGMNKLSLKILDLLNYFAPTRVETVMNWLSLRLSIERSDVRGPP